jgi:hypothetical protein
MLLSLGTWCLHGVWSWSFLPFSWLLFLLISITNLSYFTFVLDILLSIFSHFLSCLLNDWFLGVFCLLNHWAWNFLIFIRDINRIRVRNRTCLVNLWLFIGIVLRCPFNEVWIQQCILYLLLWWRNWRSTVFFMRLEWTIFIVFWTVSFQQIRLWPLTFSLMRFLSCILVGIHFSLFSPLLCTLFYHLILIPLLPSKFIELFNFFGFIVLILFFSVVLLIKLFFSLHLVFLSHQFLLPCNQHLLIFVSSSSHFGYLLNSSLLFRYVVSLLLLESSLLSLCLFLLSLLLLYPSFSLFNGS